MKKNGLKVSKAKTEHLQTTWDTNPVRMNEEIHGDGTGQLANSPVLQISRINDRQKRRSQQRRGEQSGKGMVERERADWSYLQQESSNENEGPDTPDSDSTAVASWLRNMANVS